MQGKGRPGSGLEFPAARLSLASASSPGSAVCSLTDLMCSAAAGRPSAARAVDAPAFPTVAAVLAAPSATADEADGDVDRG